MKEYAMYQGEEFLDIGTREEIMKKYNIKEKTLRYYMSKAYKNRLNKNKSKTSKARIIVSLDTEIEKEEDGVGRYSQEMVEKQNEIIQKMAKEGKTIKEIARKAGVTTRTIYSRMNRNKINTPKSERDKKIEEIKMQGYIPQKLEIGKSYKFSELDSNNRIKINSKMKGKIIEEFDSFYRLDRGKYVECINKNCMMDLIIKEM